MLTPSLDFALEYARTQLEQGIEVKIELRGGSYSVRELDTADEVPDLWSAPKRTEFIGPVRTQVSEPKAKPHTVDAALFTPDQLAMLAAAGVTTK